MASILLNGGWLLLWIIAICSLIWEDDRMTIPGLMGSTVLWITRLWSKVWLLVSKGLGALKSFTWGAILQETKGRVFFFSFWQWSGLNRVTYCDMFLPWYLIHVPSLEYGQSRDAALALGVWAVCLHIQTGELRCWKCHNSPHSGCGERNKWGNLPWIHLSRASASGSWSHLLLLAPWNLTLACLQLVHYFVQCLLFFSDVCFSVTREMILTIWV